MTAHMPIRSANRLPRIIARALIGASLLVAMAAPAAATKIERVTSPGGIEVWLVQETSVPLIAMDFAFRGGASQDPADKAGVASLVAGMIDEGAGDLDSKTFHERLESKAIELSFTANRDHFTGSLRTLTENKDAAFEMMRLALNAPRLDAADVERIRSETLGILRRESTNPDNMASQRWWETAFAGHPYGRPVRGTLDSVSTITAQDMRAYMKDVFARDTLKVGIVGNIDGAAAGALVDKVFGALPAKAALRKVALADPQGLGRVIAIDFDVQQSVVMMGGVGIPRKDPDFMAAFLVNHILGGGAFSSRLYREVREVRGLAYSIYSTLVPLDSAALFMTATATRGESAKQTLDVVAKEIRRLAESGPTEEELAKAKSYQKGSFALRFDTSTKIAAQLVQIQIDDLGIDYIDKRNDLVEAVTLADVQRVAKRLLDGGMLVTMVGRPQPAPAKGG
ncbi:MAG: zinc protease [Alphaproteobacteria bacterium]|nr:zinc protease [Alphaproteobacteria bacterium]